MGHVRLTRYFTDFILELYACVSGFVQWDNEFLKVRAVDQTLLIFPKGVATRDYVKR